jgi:hypothetical protein
MKTGDAEPSLNLVQDGFRIDSRSRIGWQGSLFINPVTDSRLCDIKKFARSIAAIDAG